MTRTEPPSTLKVVVRPASEMALKGRRVRTDLRRRLRGNIKDALRRAGLDVAVQARFSRAIVRVEPGEIGIEEARGRVRETLARVFGVGSFSFAIGHCAADPETIARTGRALFADRVRGRTYAVRCKRIGHHAFGSMDVERALGAALNDEATVDLDDPEVTVALEVDRVGTTFFSERVDGPGGLPLGVGGRALALMSGGFDSAVAAWMLMKRGIEVDFVLFKMGGVASERLALQVAKVLSDRWAAGSRPEFFSVDFGAVVDDLRASAEPGYWQLVLKRQMLRGAEAVADEIEAAHARVASSRGDTRPPLTVDALITGESVAQVSSQTLSNLRSIDGAADRPVLRPLVGMDKNEIIARAETIGTAALSARVQEYCAITPGRAVASSRPDEVRAEEAGLRPEVLAGAVEERGRFVLRALAPSDLVVPYLFTEDVPDDAVLVDCGTDDRRAPPPVPGARRVPAPELVAGRGDLDKARTYVLFCAFGTQSAHAAEVLQQLGYEAYSFRGGAPAPPRSRAARPGPARARGPGT